MQQFSSTRASQIMCTGVTIAVLGGSVFGLGYVLSYGKYHLPSILGNGAASWAGIPAILTGIIGILTGVYKKKELVKLFLIFSICCLLLGILMAAIVGMMLRDWRSKGDCKYTFCPFDEVSILLTLLVTILVLLSILALTGILEASLPLVNTDDELDGNQANVYLYHQNVPSNEHPRRMAEYDLTAKNGQIPFQTAV